MYFKYHVFVNINWVENTEVLKFQRYFAKHFNVKNEIKCISNLVYLST